MTKPTKAVICCADHDHATAPDCEFHAKEAIIELTDEEIAQRELDRIDVENRKAAEKAEADRIAALKASAKAKLISGQPLTEEEAATIVL